MGRIQLTRLRKYLDIKILFRRCLPQASWASVEVILEIPTELPRRLRDTLCQWLEAPFPFRSYAMASKKAA
jgi:hypothetical protein